MEKYSIQINTENNETVLNATNKLFMYDFFKNSITIMDILNQSHKIDLPIEIKENKAILDVLMDDVNKNIKGEFTPLVYDTNLWFDANLFYELKSFEYQGRSVQEVFVDYKNVDTDLDGFNLKFFDKDDTEVNYFNELFKVIYNNSVKYISEFLLEFLSAEELNFQTVSSYKLSLVTSFFENLPQREFYNQLALFYDTLLHESYKGVKIIDMDAHKLIGEENI